MQRKPSAPCQDKLWLHGLLLGAATCLHALPGCKNPLVNDSREQEKWLSSHFSFLIQLKLLLKGQSIVFLCTEKGISCLAWSCGLSSPGQFGFLASCGFKWCELSCLLLLASVEQACFPFLVRLNPIPEVLISSSWVLGVMECGSPVSVIACRSLWAHCRPVNSGFPGPTLAH